MATSLTDPDHPYYSTLGEIPFANVPTFFRSEEGKRMRFVTLGELLDFSATGGMNFCYWDMGPRELTDYVQDWMNVQEPRREFGIKSHSKINGAYTLVETKREEVFEWNRQKFSFPAELPYISNQSCPRDSAHNGQIRDLGGRLRCAHVDTERMRPSFIGQSSFLDKFSMTKKINFYEEKPSDPSYEDDFEEQQFPEPEYAEYVQALERWEKEEKTEGIQCPCYSIISDVGTYLSLEKVFKRLSVGECRGGIAFPFSGFELANYVAAWANQKGKRRFFIGREEDFYKKYPNFKMFCSED